MGLSKMVGAVALLIFLSACAHEPSFPPLPDPSPTPRTSPRAGFTAWECASPRPASPPPGAFAENFSGSLFTQARESGVDFVKSHCPQARGQGPSLGGGVAAGDYDRDGDLDLFFVQGGPDVLYRNEGNWKFTDVTPSAGVGGPGEGRAAAWGDYNNDGCPDLYVANLESPNTLYRNNCNSTFTNVTREAGVRYAGFTYHVAWGDYDRDGCLDLYLVNYLDVRNLYDDPLYAAYTYDRRDGEPNRLFRNNCDGTFADATNETSAGDTGYGLAAAFTDLDGDGWPDLFIANDFGPNTHLRNLGNGRFEDATNRSGAGLRANGMGVDSGDYDNDGDLDVFVPNIVWVQNIADGLGLPRGTDEQRAEWVRAMIREGDRAVQRLPKAMRDSLPLTLEEHSFLYRNRGDGTLDEVAEQAGVGRVEWGWGGQFLDADGNGWLDLYVANGYTLAGGSQFHRLPNRVFLNQENSTFTDVTAGAGAADRGDSRGVAYGDLDNDGDLDLVVVNELGPARLYRNDAGSRNHWLIVKPVGSCAPGWRGGSSPAACSNRDGIGAWVKVRAGGLSLLREVKSGSGFASGSMVPVHFGLGSNGFVSELEVRWPSGKVTRLTDVKADRWLTVDEPL